MSRFPPPSQPRLSVVVPFFNEAANVSAVLREVRQALPQAEIVAVDDGSQDGTWSRICEEDAVIGLRLTANRGQSAAIYAGLQLATGCFRATMDGDGQNDPADFPALLEAADQPGVDVAVGYRAQRKDVWSKRVASRFANRIRRAFLHDGVRDTGCSLKVFRAELVDDLVAFNGLHRYLPAFWKAHGRHVVEVPVNHRPRQAGTSKYSNWERALRGLYDLVGVAWLLNRKVQFPPREVRYPPPTDE